MRTRERGGPSSPSPDLEAADLHGSLADPALAAVNFLNGVSRRYPAAVSFAACLPCEDCFDEGAVPRYPRTFTDHLRERQGYTTAQVRRALVFGLAAPGLDGAADPVPGIDRLAEYHLRTLAAAGHTGRFVLGGWSMGGVVAYEMARQVEERTGAPVPVLLIDSRPPGPDPDAVVDDDEARRLFAADLNGLTRAGRPRPQGDEVAMARMWRVFRTNVRSAARYAPPRGFSGPVHLVRAGDEPLDTRAADLNWSAWTTGPV
ncbi:thioesterase domain-containing protein [Actinokineospora sp. PR83]|uniref:thioesterase domain-containing protein n=1 Tax=Actinokineospora sp. PR83 TaxID=2884908 RepID=UPI0027DEC314|nr:thioesterase domain-containing protein [Actinokineospora sp. PR83]MCG8914441.1 thioesterase domain-containing protein [Actinokineospora sp. PR83]